MKLRPLKKVAIVAVAAVFAMPVISTAQTNMLRYATIGEPPTLDQQVVTADLATTIAHHIFEALYAFNSANVPEGLLASGDRLEDGGKTIIISLRKGVKFHNGAEMTSADVIASLKRWGKFGSRGRALFDKVSSVDASGKYEITIKLNEPFGPWKNLLGFINGGPAIYPASVAENAGKEPIARKDYIGTGPYRFSAWEPNRYLELVRFDDYQSPKGEPDGYVGRRAAKFEKLRFIPVPDPGTRISGIKAGDYDYAESIPGDLFDDLDNDPNVTTILNGAPAFGLVFMNSKQGPLKTNFALRRAIQAALNKEDALRVAYGPERLWGANGSFYPKGSFWYTDAGADNFSRDDAEGAKEMAKAAGYAGEPIKFMVSTQYQHHYDQAVVYTRKLAQAGFNIDLQVYDWATLIQKRAQPDQWDLFFTHHGFVPDPILINVLNDNYPGWWTTPERNDLVSKFTASSNPDERKKIWDQLQQTIYSQVPTMKAGDFYSYNIASPKLKGLADATLIWPHFWNVEK